jgi:hypothetical protein
MNLDSDSLDHRLLTLLHAVRDDHDGPARVLFNDLLRHDAAARSAMARLLVEEQALIHRLRDDGIVSLLDAAPAGVREKGLLPAHPYPWRPLTAAAAGIVFGMLCSSVVYGFVVQQVPDVKRVPLVLFDPGLESAAPLDEGLPDEIGRWGVDSAGIVAAENGVQPREGEHMLRLDPIPREKDVKNHTSRVYQVLDLRTVSSGELERGAEVEVEASFFATAGETGSRYLIRGVALDEAPEQATDHFWSKTENDDVISVSQRYDTSPGDRGWQTFSLKMPLPRGAKTLVVILGAVPPEDASMEASVHYLDEVSVSLLNVVTAAADSSD